MDGRLTAGHPRLPYLAEDGLPGFPVPIGHSLAVIAVMPAIGFLRAAFVTSHS
jgi:hypothetical protein